MNIKEVTDYIGCSSAYVCRLVKMGRIKFTPSSYDSDDVMNYVLWRGEKKEAKRLRDEESRKRRDAISSSINKDESDKIDSYS